MQVGEGMSSYMAYTVTTSTNLSYFKKKNPAVNRRFSDFLGLRDKLAEKYLQNGRIIPPAPDKYYSYPVFQCGLTSFSGL